MNENVLKLIQELFLAHLQIEKLDSDLQAAKSHFSDVWKQYKGQIIDTHQEENDLVWPMERYYTEYDGKIYRISFDLEELKTPDIVTEYGSLVNLF